MEVKCTQCGGAVAVAERQGLAKCKFCGSSLYVDVREAVGHFVLAPVLKEKDLTPQLTTWLTRKERKSRFRVTSSFLVYWPFWEIQNKEGRASTFIAAAHPITAMEQAGTTTGNLKPYSDEEQERILFQPPDDPIAEFLERKKLAAKQAWLVHLPFWQVLYDYDGVEYEAWVDAVRGEVYADDMPPTFAKSKDKVYRKAVAAGFLIYLIAGALAPSGNWAMLFMLLASAPAYFVISLMLKDEFS